MRSFTATGTNQLVIQVPSMNSSLSFVLSIQPLDPDGHEQRRG